MASRSSRGIMPLGFQQSSLDVLLSNRFSKPTKKSGCKNKKMGVKKQKSWKKKLGWKKKSSKKLKILEKKSIKKVEKKVGVKKMGWGGKFIKKFDKKKWL